MRIALPTPPDSGDELRANEMAIGSKQANGYSCSSQALKTWVSLLHSFIK